MKFDELDAKMRVFETSHDHCVLPGLWMVARLDGRGFTRLTKDVHRFDAPFDVRFRDLMVATTESLVFEFNSTYGYTQSDEISLLFPFDCDTFNRKLRKLNSVLAGHASAFFALALGAMASFDCRICQFPSAGLVVDYFRWRNEDAHRNALNAHCYWAMRNEGQSGQDASNALLGLSAAEKNELLFRRNVNFNDLPGWQKRGVGLYWEPHAVSGHNPTTGRMERANRKRLHRDFELPMKNAYGAFIASIVDRDVDLRPVEGRAKA